MGLIHLDAGVVIGFLDADDAHHNAARGVLTEALRQGDQLAMAASAYAECLISPTRRGEAAVRVVRELFERLPISVVVLDAETAAAAARLRATHRSLRLPDALVIASAAHAGADRLVTTDRNWPKPRALKVRTTITQL